MHDVEVKTQSYAQIKPSCARCCLKIMQFGWLKGKKVGFYKAYKFWR